MRQISVGSRVEIDQVILANAEGHRRGGLKASRPLRTIHVLAWLHIFTLLLGFLNSAVAEPPRTVVVGSPGLRPIAFAESNYKWVGLSVTVLDTIAAREGWKISRVTAPWLELLKKLENREIDILEGITYAAKRARRFELSRESLMNNWAVVYAPVGSSISSLPDLNGKTVAVSQSSGHTKELIRVAGEFGVNFKPLMVSGFSGVFEMLEKGKADAGLVSRTFGIGQGEHFGLLPTPIMLDPRGIGYAAPKGKNRDIIAAIDRYLVAAKVDPASAYNRGLKQWVGVGSKTEIPHWFVVAVSAIGLTLMVALISAAFLRHQVKKRTFELDASEKRFRTIFENAADGIISVDERGLIESFNPAAERIFGYVAQDVIGGNVSILMNEDDAKSHDGYIRDYLKSGKAKIIGVGLRELMGKREDGSTLPLELTVDEMSLSDRRLFIGNVRDITARKEAERAAAEKSALLETIIDTLGHGVMVFDEDMGLVRYNDVIAGLLNLPEEVLRPGTSFNKITRYRAGRGDYGDGDVEEIVKDQFERAKSSPERTGERTLPNGTVYIHHRKPMPAGGCVISYTDITERKRIESALRNSEERFRRAFENSGVGMVIRNLRDRTLVTNDAFQEMVGYSQEELQALHLSDITHPEDRHENKKFRRKLLDGGADNVLVTKRYIRKTGEPVWLINEMSAVRDADGQLAYTINLFQDITARKLAEDEAAEKSALLETTIETMAQGCVVYDADLRLAAFNAQYERMFGFPSGFLRPGLSLEDVIRHRSVHWLDSTGSSTEDRIKKHVERGRDPEERTQERDLTSGITFVYHRRPLPGGGFITTYTDITQRKRAEQEAVEQSRLLEATFQSMSQGVAVYDADQNLTRYNQKFLEMGGYPPGFISIGMNRADIIRYRMAITDGGENDHEKLIRARMDSARACEEHLSEVVRPDGNTLLYQRTPIPDGGFIATYTDITERREAAKQLQQAQKMEAVGQLTGGIAHDFNNLLAVSLGNVELAEEVIQSGGDIRPFLETIKRATERGASLTNQLLAFSRKQTLFPQVVDAGELVSEIAGLLRSSLGETIEVKVTGGDDIWPCEVDPHQLESAVLNLSINARDAMPGGGTLTIQTANIRLDDDYAAAQAKVEQGAYVIVAVSDTGTGMSKDVIDQVFEPFFTTKEVGRGSGLGLSMVYGFAKQSGGHVTIHSHEGEGTTIKLYLPRSDKDREEERLGQADQTDILEARGETVMVVEDDPEVRTLSVALLRSFGYEILEAGDGETALKMLETEPRVNLLFTDVVLAGGMSGLELAVEVRSRFPGIAVLYTSGYTELVNFDRSLFDEDTELLQKPYRKADLARNVRLVLDQAQS